MAEMRDAMRNAGYRESKAPRSSSGGRSGPGAGQRLAPIFKDYVPSGYPRYFTDDGFTRVELVQDEAQRIASCFRDDNLTRHQLRAFYDHAKKQLQRLDYGAPFGRIHPEIARLKAIAADRARRANNPLPNSFKEFLDRNVDAVKDEKTFRSGFMPHFEAVVAYCAILRER